MSKAEAAPVGAADLLHLLADSRTAMLTLFGMYVTGVGILFAVWAQVDSAVFRIVLALISIAFMWANYAGFRANLTWQDALYQQLQGNAERSGMSSAMVDALRPFPLGQFNKGYIAVSGIVILAAIVLAAPPVQNRLNTDILKFTGA